MEEPYPLYKGLRDVRPQTIDEVKGVNKGLKDKNTDHYPQSEPLVLIVRIYIPSPSHHLFTIHCTQFIPTRLICRWVFFIIKFWRSYGR